MTKDTKSKLTLYEALNEIDVLDIGQCKKTRIEAHVRFCRKYNIPYDLKELVKMSRREVRDLKTKYSRKRLTLGVGSKVWCNTLPNCLDRVVCLKNGKFCIETIYIDAVTGKWTIEHSTKHKV